MSILCYAGVWRDVRAAAVPERTSIRAGVVAEPVQEYDFSGFVTDIITHSRRSKKNNLVICELARRDHDRSRET